MNLKILSPLFFAFLLNFLVVRAHASSPVFDLPFAPIADDSTDIVGFIQGLYGFTVSVAGILAVGMIVAGAILYTVSGAIDKKKDAKDMIISAIWGLALVFGSYIILKTINPRLVELQQPGGGNLEPVVTAGSCTRENPNLPANTPECGPNQAPLSTSTPPTCQCVIKERPQCPEEVLNDCQPQRVEVKETVEVFFPVCRPGLVIKEGEGCIWGWPGSVGGPPRSRWEKETFQEGDTYWQYPYYPKLSNPANNAQCVPYAHQRRDKDEPQREGDFGGLKPC